MADIVGTVAAVGQFIDAAFKLRKIYSDVRKTPKTIAELVEETSTIIALLGDPLLCAGRFGSVDSAWHSSYKQFQSAAESLKLLVEHAEVMIKTHPRRGLFQAFLRKDEIQECRDRLERFKSSFLFAQMTCMRTEIGEQTMILTQIHTALPRLLDLISTTSNHGDEKRILDEPTNTSGVYVNRSNRCVSPPRFLFGTDYDESSRSHDFSFPRWISSRALQISLGRSAASFRIRMRVYNVRSWCDPLIQAACQARWESVFQMIDSRRASPFDIADDGTTLIQFALSTSDVHAFRKLLRLGAADYSEPPHRRRRNLVSFSVSDMARFGSIRSVNNEAMSELLCFLEFDFLEQITADRFDENQTITSLPPEPLQIFIERTSPLYCNLPDRTRAMFAINGSGPESINLLLGPNLSLKEAMTLPHDRVGTAKTIRRRWDLFNTQLAYRHPSETEMTEITKEWTPIIAEIIDFERSEERWPFYKTSHVMKFLHLYFHWHPEPAKIQSDESLTQALRMWIRCLRDIGVNLDHYSQAEKNAFIHRSLTTITYNMDFWHPKSVDRLSAPMNSMRICGLLCGPEINEWRVFTVPGYYSRFGHCTDAEYEMAGSFWRWIENPEEWFIPGSWLDSGGEHDHWLGDWEEDPDDERFRCINPVF